MGNKKQVPEMLLDSKDWRGKYCSWHHQCEEYAPIGAVDA